MNTYYLTPLKIMFYLVCEKIRQKQFGFTFLFNLAKIFLNSLMIRLKIYFKNLQTFIRLDKTNLN